jgi:hypothetical protein
VRTVYDSNCNFAGAQKMGCGTPKKTAINFVVTSISRQTVTGMANRQAGQKIH